MRKPYKSQNEQLITTLNNKYHFAIWGKRVKLNVRKRSSWQSADHENFTKSCTVRVFVVDIIVLPRIGLPITNFMEKVKARIEKKSWTTCFIYLFLFNVKFGQEKPNPTMGRLGMGHYTIQFGCLKNLQTEILWRYFLA